MCVPFVGSGFAHQTHRNPTTKGTKYTKRQGVVTVNVFGSGVSHPFREAVGCLSSIILFVCFVTFVVPLRGFGCSDPEYRRLGRTHPRPSAVNTMEVIVGHVSDVPVARRSRRSATEIRPARHRLDLGKTRVSRSSRRRNASRGATSPTRSISEKSTTFRLCLRLNRVHSTGLALPVGVRHRQTRRSPRPVKVIASRLQN